MDQQAPSKTETKANPGYRPRQGLEADTLRKDSSSLEYGRAGLHRLPKASVNHVVLGGSRRKESNATPSRLANMRIAIRRIDADIGREHADKINLNRRLNATVEAMAQALFESWFVDFDPVRLRLSYNGQVRLTKDNLAGLPANAELTEPLMAKIKVNLHQFRNPATLRDTLLPKLVGEESTTDM